MWCTTKYTTDHQCVRSQLYNMLVDERIKNFQNGEEFNDCVKTLEEVGEEPKEAQQTVISLYAMMETRDSQTMRLYGKIKNTQVVILVDSRRTHNFMDQRLVKRLGCFTQYISRVGVSIANGARL